MRNDILIAIFIIKYKTGKYKNFARLSVNIEPSQNLYVSNKFVKKNSIKPQ
jgi:hypothetical protein